MCDDKRGFAKYSWKKLPEICDDRRFLILSTAELLPNIYDNHQVCGGCHKLLAQCQKYLAAVLKADQGDRKRRNLFCLVLDLDYDL